MMFRLCLVLLACIAVAPAAYAKEPTAEVVSQFEAGDELVYVKLQTSKGDIYLALNKTKAPVTVDNFLAYVKSYYYDRLIFHRVVPGRLIQTGGYNKGLYQRARRDAIKNEADNGLKNLRGTVAMARYTQPDTARSEFFINLQHNEELDHKGKEYSLDWGYAVFAEVVHGMDVVEAIAAVEVGDGEIFDGEFPQETILMERVDEITKEELDRLNE
jgi:cyclophilin family peptidyl-prolyl cis-trans isomerase